MSGTPESEIRLFDYPMSSACYRVRIALQFKGISYAQVKLDLRKGAQSASGYRALNPQGLVPLLEIDGHRINQSLAIIDYLDARFPNPPLVPKGAAARAEVLARSLMIAADIHPLNNLRVLRYLKHELDADEDARDGWYRHWIGNGFAALEEKAARNPLGRYLSGDQPGLADICLVPQMLNARRYEVPLDAFPTLVGIDAELINLPAFVAAHPDRAG